MKCQILFSRKNKKHIISLLSAEFACLYIISAISADYKLMIFFPSKQGLTFYAKCGISQTQFSRKNKKIIQNTVCRCSKYSLYPAC